MLVPGGNNNKVATIDRNIENLSGPTATEEIREKYRSPEINREMSSKSSLSDLQSLFTEASVREMEPSYLVRWIVT